MSRRDIGIVGDLDEVFTRDFLLALQSCEYPRLTNETYCKDPKWVGSKTLVFESMPTCINAKRWFHPDFITGECIEGVGDPTGRVVPVRHFQREWGGRVQGYGTAGGYSDAVKTVERYPLWNTQDFRNVGGAIPQPHPEQVTAYHFHNFFNDLATTRHKYMSYGHGSTEKGKGTLSNMAEDFDLTVRCVHDLPNSVINVSEGKTWPYREEQRKDNDDLPIPIYFQNKSYVKERHAFVTHLVVEDEATHGSKYQKLLLSSTKKHTPPTRN
eukprot:CAMPEP_0116548758 /NCGR_PEP_ID=MMETSP0397-20121206/4513_1 /TAXON_ID=216820 /ORGANISM="Cyclophora tenuis, Strain ECT3854" /LENGTH=268 /DNA_ID=CAMNT_0004073441 /DNA_START=48 /DNA_END=854 /DNA_ORIENTATION=+